MTHLSIRKGGHRLEIILTVDDGQTIDLGRHALAEGFALTGFDQPPESRAITLSCKVVVDELDIDVDALDLATVTKGQLQESVRLRAGLEEIIAEPDDTQWWPVQPYADPPNEDETVEVQVADVARLRALLEEGDDRG